METPTRTGARSGSPTRLRNPPYASATAAKPGRSDSGPVCPKAEMRVMMSSGLASLSTSGPRPHFSSVPGRKFSSRMSDFAASCKHGLLAGLGPQVQHHGLLVAVDGAVQHGGIALVQAPVAQLVAGSGPLHLDDFGAEVGEEPACRGRGDVVSELQDADAVQRRDAWLCHGVLLLSWRSPGIGRSRSGQNSRLMGRISRIATTEATETPTVTDFSAPRTLWPSRTAAARRCCW